MPRLRIPGLTVEPSTTVLVPARQVTHRRTRALSRRPRGLTAAAVQINVDDRNQAATVVWGGTEWQLEGWAHHDTCPELHAAATVIGNALSRAQLIAVDVNPSTGRPGTDPTINPQAAARIRQLFGGATGQSQAMRAYGRNLTVAGDCWTLAVDDPDLDQQSWEILSVAEVTSVGAGQLEYQRMDGTRRRIDPETDLLFRVWQPHPRRRWEADSAVRALLPVLRELASLTASVVANVQSRLAMNGLLLIPDQVDPPDTGDDTPSEDEFGELPSKQQRWSQAFGAVASETLSKPGTAAAALPLIATMSADEVVDFIAKVRLIDFSKDLDGQIDTLRQSAIKRVAVGLDLPPTILMGTEDANHWSAWLEQEDFVKTFLAPMLELIADALTTHYLRPALVADGLNPDLYAVGFDLTDLLPEKYDADKAMQAWGTGELKSETMLTALGFDSDRDRADATERLFRLVMDMMGRGNPQTLQELLPVLQALFPGFTLAPLAAPPVAGGPTPAAAPAAPSAGVGPIDPGADARTPPATPAAPPDPTPPEGTP